MSRMFTVSKFVKVSFASCVLVFALHQNANAMGPNVVFTPDKGSVGTSFQIKGTMFHPNEKVFINWDHPGTSLGQATADADGALILNAGVPEGAADGSHRITLAGDQGSVAVHIFTLGDAGSRPVVKADADRDDEDESNQDRLIYAGAGVLIGAGAILVLQSLRGREKK